MKKIITKNFAVLNAQSFENSIASAYANVYVMLARSVPWANVSNSANLDDTFIANPYDTVAYRNDIAKKGIILKKITSSDIQTVVPRVDWATGTVYTQYDQTANLYIKVVNTAIAGGNVDVRYLDLPINGTVNVSNGLANTITTTNIANLNFVATTPSELNVGDLIRIGNERRTIIQIDDDGNFAVVNSNFSQGYTANAIFKSVTLSNTVTTTNIAQLNLAFSTPSLTTGDFIRIAEETREIVRVNTRGDFIQVNSDFSQIYTSETLYKVVSSDYQYSNKFYVRNNLDQVFKCLFNNNGAQSTIKPEITLGGQLPESPYIETSDGYKWKYLYTIPSGLKNKFFTDRYMPVISDPVVVRNAKDGRIDIVEIINPGNGYFQGTTTNNYSIITVSGDGTDAEFSVDILNGKIVEVNIIDGGTGYTNATLEIGDALKLPATSNANLRAVISPPGGHGIDPALELGASEQMITVDFQSNITDLYPIDGAGDTDFRQVALVRNPKLANGFPGFTSVYPMYTKIFVSAPSTAPYPIDSTLFVGNGGNFANATFTATVVFFDTTENIVYVNNINGDIDAIDGEQIYEKDNTSNYSQVFAVTKPDINILSGDLLYVENRNKITRNANQTETIKIVVEF